MNRIMSIDGLRALSIIMVLLGHSAATMSDEVANNLLFKLFANSNLGVKFFFVISGYLITKLLIIEKEKTNFINIKHFYLRRAFRILPIFYLYIFVIIFLKWTFVTDIVDSYLDVLPASFYLWNYKHFWTSVSGKGSWFLGHFWSLSMEEQFYLLWPFVFSFFYAKSSNIKLIKLVSILILIMPFLRLLTYVLTPDSRGYINMMLHTGGDAILIGCLGALIEGTNAFKAKYLLHLQNKFLIVFTVFFLFVFSPLLSINFKGAYDLPIGMTLNNVFILIFLFWCIYVPTKFSSVLNNRILVQIGVLSYSLYVWQQLFLTNRNDFWVNKFPQNIFIVFLVGFASYYLIEKPILKLKNRYKAVSAKHKVTEEVILVNTEQTIRVSSKSNSI